MDSLTLIIAVLAVAAIGVAVWAALANRGSSSGQQQTQEAAHNALIAQLSANQADLAARLQMMTESQGQLTRTIEQRFEHVSKRLGDGLSEHSQRTGDVIKQVHERLAVIDAAQKNLSSLTDQMVGLQDILSNKQARGAFGEIQLNDLVTDALPPSAYTFQATLSNGKRADCLLKLPNPPGSIVIDSKFPLESYLALRNAENDDARKVALRSFGTDVLNHVRAIAEKYIVAGETAESALMFLPSEAVYAELHASLPEVIEKSYRARVWIVSPTTLMATLNTVRAVLKDASMREQAGVIQSEVLKMLDDVTRLDDRVAKLQKHFTMTEEDIRQIRISTDKVTRQGEKIEAVQLADDTPAEELEPGLPPSPPQGAVAGPSANEP